MQTDAATTVEVIFYCGQYVNGRYARSEVVRNETISFPPKMTFKELDKAMNTLLKIFAKDHGWVPIKEEE